jgi:predicted metal-dependent hydrolase
VESVDNFLQDSLFGDTLPSVIGEKKSEKFQRIKPLPDNLPEFRVIRSSRRKRSMSAYRQNGIIEIHIPDRMSRKDEFAAIPEMIEIVLRREAKNRSSDQLLETMAADLLRRFLPDFHERPSSITWRNMRERWGSCTTGDGTIRISLRLNGAPEYVIACVVFHELIHLRIPGHGTDFQEFLDRYTDKDRAEAFLEGFEAGISAMPEPILHQ